MPKSTVEQENPYKLPEETFLPALLVHVEEKRFPIRTGKRAGEEFVKWTWEFEITQGEYKGLHAYGDTEPKVTVMPNGERNTPAQWIEAIRELEVDFGEGIDTDQYDGLPCVITVRHESRDRSDGQGKFYSEPVKDVYPASLMSELAAAGAGGPVQPEEPPF